jgi:hypothetical protein
VLFAFDPFLTRYAQETRMYALVVLLGVVVCGTFALALVQRRRAALPWFAVALAALLYTHNWALFLAAGLGVAWLVLLAGADDRRGLLRDGALGFGGAVALFAPWIPSLLFQAQHTGAPWARVPSFTQLHDVPEALLGDQAQIALLVGAGAGLAASRSRPALAIGGAGVAAIGLAWLASQVEPAWAVRYLAIGAAPVLLLAAAGLGHAGRLGIAVLALTVLLWDFSGAPADKSNVRDVARALEPGLRPGDLVVSTQPEQVPVLRYYLPEGLRYATLWGALEETGVSDWRDGVERLQATRPGEDLKPLVDTLPAGRRLVLVEPIIYSLDRWSAPWTALVRMRSAQWRDYALADPALAAVATVPASSEPQRPNPVRATVFVKRRIR